MSTPKVFLLDVDGVLTTGQFCYTAEGKAMKTFGPDDHDALSLLTPFLKIGFVTGDRKGFEISRRRVVEDMKFPLDLVSTVKRVDWIEAQYGLKNVIYMGDGILDHYVFRKVAYSIAPAGSHDLAKRYANYITTRSGGDRAVAEACLHILEKFFEPYDPEKELVNSVKFSGEWSA